MYGFWVGGAESYKKALKEDYEKRVVSLQDKLDKANSKEERESLKREIQEEKQKHKRSLAEVLRKIF